MRQNVTEGYPMLPLLVSDNLGKISVTHSDTNYVIWDAKHPVGDLDQSEFEELKMKVGGFEALFCHDDATKIPDTTKIDVNNCKVLFTDHDRGHFFEPLLKKAVDTANLEQPVALKMLPEVGEMFLQQSIFCSFSELFFSISPDEYVADQQVNCCHAVREKINGQTSPVLVSVLCKPDGAIKATEKYYVTATMEIKPKIPDVNKEDMAKSVLLTSMSALAFRECGVMGAISIPFLIGSRDTARLYVTVLGEEKRTPEIKFVEVAYLHEQTQKARLFAKLVILLENIRDVIRKYPNLERDLGRIAEKNPLTKLNNVFSSSQRSASSNTDERKSAKQSKNENVPNEDCTIGSTAISFPSKREEIAKEIASRGGQIQALDYPWPRLRVLDFGDLSPEFTEQSKLDYYQQQSPFYFVGCRATSNNMGGFGGDAVFCKVWREGDDKTDLECIKKEIAMLKEANMHGVPSPTLQEDLSALNVVSPMNLGKERFHVMVMSKMACDRVSHDDVCDFALSLIRAVRKLHSIGILHCDIKPSNVAWNADAKTASLVDFGHAQREDVARAYRATTGFEAPEIEKGEPHTPSSDAYSVGKTLGKVSEKIQAESLIGGHGLPDSDTMKTLWHVVEKLSSPVSYDRLTLDEAESLLSGAMTLTASPPHKKQCAHIGTPITPTPNYTSALGHD